MSHSKAKANLVAKSMVFLFITGRDPGKPKQIGQT